MTKNVLAVIFGVLVTGSVLTESWLALFIAIVILIALPPSWDPAIRFKEWINRGKR